MRKNSNNKLLLDKYYYKFNELAKLFFNDKKNIRNMNKCIGLLKKIKKHGSVVYIIGNGGSAAVAEHIAIDLTKNAGLKALAVSGTPMLTTFSNDYGYENVFKKYIERFATKNDVLIAISSSGQSKNIVNACRAATKKKLKIITLSGFQADNPLRKLGHINFWVESKAFGYLEMLHGMILHWINDSLIGSETYMIR